MKVKIEELIETKAESEYSAAAANQDGVTQFTQGNYTGAIVAFSQAIECDDKNAYYYMNRAIARYVLNKDDVTAKGDYSQAIRLLPHIMHDYTHSQFQTIFQDLSLPKRVPIPVSSTIVFGASSHLSMSGISPSIPKAF